MQHPPTPASAAEVVEVQARHDKEGAGGGYLQSVYRCLLACLVG